MIQTVFSKCLGKGYKSYESSVVNFEDRIKDIEATFIKLVSTIYSDDYVTDKSILSQYKFIADSNLMRCLQASSLVYSDSFKNRLHMDEYAISTPKMAMVELSRDSINASGGKILEAKDWNNYWKDMLDAAGITKPLVSIEKKHILLQDLSGIYVRTTMHNLKNGVIPFEMCSLLGYQWDDAYKLSPDLVREDEYDLESWVLEGLK